MVITSELDDLDGVCLQEQVALFHLVQVHRLESGAAFPGRWRRAHRAFRALRHRVRYTRSLTDPIRSFSFTHSKLRHRSGARARTKLLL